MASTRLQFEAFPVKIGPPSQELERFANGEFFFGHPVEERYFNDLPLAFRHKGYIFAGRRTTKNRLETIEKLDFNPEDILLISYPKSGTTWLRQIASLALNKDFDDSFKKQPFPTPMPFHIDTWLEADLEQIKKVKKGSEDFEKISQNAEGQTLLWSHLPLDLLPENAKKCKILYIARNGLDVSVSYHHFHTFLDTFGPMDIKFEDFVQLFMRGKLFFGSWFEHVRDYYNFSKTAKNFCFVKYEDLKQDLPGEISRICKFLGSDRTPEEQLRIAESVEFKSMKNTAKTGEVKNTIVKNFFRKGIVGDWKKHYKVAEYEQFREIYAEIMQGSDLQFEFL